MFLESPSFPYRLAMSLTGGPSFSTDVVVVNSGAEQRNANWPDALCRFDAAHGIKDTDDMAALVSFFRVMQGRAHGVRVKDWSDYQCLSGAGILVATGVTDEWQMWKRYTTGSSHVDRKIVKPVASSVTVSGSGTYTYSTTTGIVTKTSGSDPTGWVGEFDVPCRFDTDQMRLSIDNYNDYEWGQIPIVEIRL